VTSSFTKTVLEPAESSRVASAATFAHGDRVWVYRYQHRSEPWTLAIATHASPGSEKLSLGGFRIAPEERTSLEGFNPTREAIELAVGMEEKVYWSRLLRIGGPLAQRDFDRIVGGKCVLLPTPDARVGCPRDFAILDFAIECLNDCAAVAGIHITTGQDLGHGVMSDGKTASLEYLNRGFAGSVVADTSVPTAEGNYWVLRGMLRGFELPVERATIGLVGVGHIGGRVLDHLCGDGARLLAVEARGPRRAEIAGRGIRVWSPDGRSDFLREPMDALVLNAAGGSLDDDTITQCMQNERLKILCGSENLVMPNVDGVDYLRRAHKAYCPTELGGMMGYLTAVEEYLAHLEGEPFRVETLIDAARGLEPVGYKATKRVRDSGFAVTFEDALRGQ
jgi:hypothetical protein